MLKQMNLEDMMLSRMSHSQKDKILYDSTHMRYLESQIHRDRKQNGGCQGLGEGGGAEHSYYIVGFEFQFCKMEEFWRWIVVMVEQQCEYS